MKPRPISVRPLYAKGANTAVNAHPDPERLTFYTERTYKAVDLYLEERPGFFGFLLVTWTWENVPHVMTYEVEAPTTRVVKAYE